MTEPDTPQFRYEWAKPWIVKDAVDWLAAYLHPHMYVFEWGSGGSTIWFSKRAARIYTVEHQPEWAEALRELSRLNLVIFEKPAIYPNFEEYAAAIDGLGEFDIIMIDGADGYDLGYVGSRLACAKRAISHVKLGGAVVLDNAGSASNIEAANILEAAFGNREKFVGPILEPEGRPEEVTETSIFVRRE